MTEYIFDNNYIVRFEDWAYIKQIERHDNSFNIVFLSQPRSTPGWPNDDVQFTEISIDFLFTQGGIVSLNNQKYQSAANFLIYDMQKEKGWHDSVFGVGNSQCIYFLCEFIELISVKENVSLNQLRFISVSSSEIITNKEVNELSVLNTQLYRWDPYYICGISYFKWINKNLFVTFLYPQFGGRREADDKLISIEVLFDEIDYAKFVLKWVRIQNIEEVIFEDYGPKRIGHRYRMVDADATFDITCNAIKVCKIGEPQRYLK